jgi:hypothetical protein
VLSLLIQNSEAAVITDLLKFHNKLLNEDKHELSYVLFTAIDGEKTRKQLVPEQFSEVEQMAGNLVELMLSKLEEFLKASSGKIDSSKCMKVLVLVLKPLEEAIKLCSVESESMPKNWRERVSQVLKQMSPILPLQNQSKVTPPNSLIDSYVQLTLLADRDFQTVKPPRLRFETFYQLFVRVENQLAKAPQNALVMAKLFQLCQYVSVPEQDKPHFYEHLGRVSKQILSTKDFNIFLVVMTAFMDWAKTTELDDLNFMVPDDEEVKQLLQNFVQHSRFDVSEG